MFSAADLPDTLAVFPLPGALLLPRAPLPLHIFEPRFLAMIDDTLKTSHRLIGMIQPLPDAADGGPLHQIGCAGRLTAFSETDDRRYMLTLTGVSRFQVTSEIEGFTPYRKFTVDWSRFDRDLGAPERDTGLDRDRFFTLLQRYFTCKGLESDWESLRDADDELLINSLAMLCPFDLEEKQALLEAATLADRRLAISQLFEYATAGGADQGVMQ